MRDSAEPVILVGAGIGGLFAALCFQQVGIDCVLLEKSRRLEEVGAGIQIGANGSRLLHKLGLQNALAGCVSVPAKGFMMDGIRGRWICDYPLNDFSQRKYQLPHYQIRRADLQAILLQALQERAPDCLHLGTELVELHQTDDYVEAVCSEGRSFRGRALVGCDGIHSRTRQLLFDKTHADFAGCIAWRAMLPRNKLDLAGDLNVPKIWIGPGRHLVQYPVAAGEMVNLVACVDSQEEVREEWQGSSPGEEFVQSFSDWCPEVKKIVEAAEGALKWGLYERPVLENWNVGRVSLLGDAAHAMLPSMAQGAVMALEDAEQLAQAFAQCSDSRAALGFYQTQRIGRSRQVQSVARKNMQFFHQQRPVDRLSAKALQLSGKRAENLIGRRYNWLYGYRAGSGGSANSI